MCNSRERLRCFFDLMVSGCFMSFPRPPTVPLVLLYGNSNGVGLVRAALIHMF